MATINHTISVSSDFHAWAEEMHLSWTEAARVGMAILLQEAGAMDRNDATKERVQEVLEKTLLQKRVTKLNLLLKDAADKIAAFEEKNGEKL